MNGGKAWGFVFHLVILFVLSLTLFKDVFALHGALFAVEFLILLVIVLAAVVGMVRLLGKGQSRALMGAYGLSLINSVVLFAFTNELMAVPVLLAALGFFLSMMRARHEYAVEKDPWATDDVKIEEIEPEPVIEIAEPIVAVEKVVKKATRKKTAKKKTAKKKSAQRKTKKKAKKRK
jgi:hypothetical protein